MPGIGGLSIANNLLSNAVQLNLNNNQKALQASTTRLSSGLRINTAADDPSGLAISQTLQAQVNGFDQASQNVQNATNAATVADGALQTTTDILQRIRSLAVEAASDITSSSDKQDIQTEINQLLLEVNRVAQNTQFNGITLLDGTHAGFQPEQSAFITLQSNVALASAGAAGSITLTQASGGAPPVGFTNGTFTAQPQALNGSGVTGVNPTGWTTNAPGNVRIYNGSDPYADAVPSVGQGVALAVVGTNLAQTLTGLTPNATYTISFQAGSPTGQPQGGTVTVSNGNGTNVVSSFTTNAGGTFSSVTTETFQADANGDATVTFTHSSGNTDGLDLSDITLNLVGGVQTGQLVGAVATNANFNTSIGTPANGLEGIQGFTSATLTSGYTVDGTIELQIINTGASIAAQETFFASGVTTSPVSVAGELLAANSISTLFDNVQVVLGNFSTSDVGTTAYIKVAQNVAALSNPSNPALTFQSGALEGATIQLGIAAANTQTLRISNVNVLQSTASDPSIGAEDAIGQIDLALQSLLTERASLGAIIVRLGEDEDNDNVASVNLQASESNIADLDVASETTNFNKLQILVQVGTSVLAQSNSNAQSVLKLFP